LKVKTINSTNWTPLTINYGQDSLVNFQNTEIYSDSNINLIETPITSSPLDLKNNNYSLLNLTSQESLESVLSIETPTLSSNNYFVTYISTFPYLSGGERYWTTDSTSGGLLDSIFVTGTQTSFDTTYFFEVTLIDNVYCYVAQNFPTTKRFLYYDQFSNTVGLLSSANPSLSYTFDKQKFRYFYKISEGSFALAWDNTDNLRFITWDSNTQQLSSAPYLSGGDPFPLNSKFFINPQNFDLQTTLSNDFYVYTKELGTDNLNVDLNRTYGNLENNYLLHSEYYNLSGSGINFNLLTLKNELNSNDEQSVDSSGFYKSPVNHRNYQKLFSGSYQQKGFQQLNLGFEDRTAAYTFKSGQVTYFHTPQTFSVFQALNINDSSLVTMGAIGGHSPLTSDKIWKKQADYKFSSIYGNPTVEQNGTWACTWLSAGSLLSNPIWVDRWFNPRNISQFSALSSLGGIVPYFSTYDCLTSYNLSTYEVFDVPSKLTFEPGCFYAYYHWGNFDSSSYITAISGNIISSDIPFYKTTNGQSLTPKNNSYSFDGSSYAYFAYSFQGQYQQVFPINFKELDNTFSMSFWMDKKDWTTNSGHELIGNYKEDGLGFFSENIVSPVLKYVSGNSINFYNSQFSLLDSLTLPNPPKFLIYTEPVGNIHVITSDANLYRIDSKGTILDKVYNTALSGIAVSWDSNYAYILNNNSGNWAQVNLQTDQVLTSTQLPNIITRSALTNTYAVSSLLYSDVHEVLYLLPGTYPQFFNDNIIYYLYNNSIYSYDLNCQVNYAKYFNSKGTINTFKIDQYKNTWIIANNQTIYCYSSAGSQTFNTTISGVSSQVISIDFIDDIVNGSKVTSCLFTTWDGNNTNLVVTDTLSCIPSEMFQLSFTPTLSSCLNPTNNYYNYYYLEDLYSSSNLNFKIKLINVYNSTSELVIDLPYNTYDLKTGNHHFGLVFSSINGYVKFYVNGVMVSEAIFDKNKYNFSDIITEPLTFGASPFYDGIQLWEYLNQPTHFTCKDLSITNPYIIGRELTDNEMLIFYRELAEIDDLEFDVPCGQRSKLDVISRYFRQRIPGNKSNIFDVNVNNSQVTDPTSKSFLQQSIINNIQNTKPAYSNFRNINWKELL